MRTPILSAIKDFILWDNPLKKEDTSSKCRELLKSVEDGAYCPLVLFVAAENIMEDPIAAFDQIDALSIELEKALGTTPDRSLIVDLLAAEAFMDLSAMLNNSAVFNNTITAWFSGSTSTEMETDVEPDELFAFIILLEVFHNIPKGKFLERASYEIQQYAARIFHDNSAYPFHSRFDALEDVWADMGASFSSINYNKLKLLYTKADSEAQKEEPVFERTQQMRDYCSEYLDKLVKDLQSLIDWKYEHTTEDPTPL